MSSYKPFPRTTGVRRSTVYARREITNDPVWQRLGEGKAPMDVQLFRDPQGKLPLKRIPWWAKPPRSGAHFITVDGFRRPAVWID